ncbi:hypothetical protein IGI39_004769 [Enterococcus sp. AZ135]|uniref:hypothetical protein n=1 Tax=unclassified Enterococcus TaxID=2608891 RepID=UPI003F29535C
MISLFKKKSLIYFRYTTDLLLPDTPVDMYEGIFLLEKANQKLIDQHLMDNIEIIVTDRKANTLFQFSVTLPTDQNLMEVVTSAVENPFQTLGGSENHVQESLISVNKESTKAKEIAPDIKYSKTVESLDDEPTEIDQSMEQKESVERKLKTKWKFSIIINNTRFTLKQFLLGALCICILPMGITYGVSVVKNHTVNEEKKIPSYEQLVENKDYETALKSYPDEETNLIETLYSNKDEKILKELAEKDKSQLALFYWSFLKENWSKVTDIQNIPQSETIQAMKGFAYLKQGKFEEAKLINQAIKNKTLSSQIKLYQKEKAYDFLRAQNLIEAEKINQEIKDSDLQEDITVAKSIVNLLKKYESDSRDSSLSDKERKEAKKDYDTWLNNLKKLGGKTNDE